MLHLTCSTVRNKLLDLAAGLRLWKHLTCVFDSKSLSLSAASWFSATACRDRHAVGPASTRGWVVMPCVKPQLAWPICFLHTQVAACVLRQEELHSSAYPVMISSISAADKAGWALIELKLEFWPTYNSNLFYCAVIICGSLFFIQAFFAFAFHFKGELLQRLTRDVILQSFSHAKFPSKLRLIYKQR